MCVCVCVCVCTVLVLWTCIAIPVCMSALGPPEFSNNQILGLTVLRLSASPCPRLSDASTDLMMMTSMSAVGFQPGAFDYSAVTMECVSEHNWNQDQENTYRSASSFFVGACCGNDPMLPRSRSHSLCQSGSQLPVCASHFDAGLTAFRSHLQQDQKATSRGTDKRTLAVAGRRKTTR